MAQSMLLYWGSGSPPCWRVMIALEEKQLQGYKHKHLSFDKNEHKCEEVKALNPRVQVRSDSAFKSQGTRLIPDDPAEQALVYQRVFETNNLQQKMCKCPQQSTHFSSKNMQTSSFSCCFSCSAFKSQGTRLIPDDPAEQALVYQRVFETNNLQQKMYDVAFYEWYVPEGERHESALKRNKESLIAELKLWDGYLEKMGKGSYLAGKNFTMADVVCFPVIAFFPRLHLKAVSDIPDGSNICTVFCSDDVAFYEWYVPEGERHESALKRNKESLIAELKLWDGYLEKMGKGSYLAGKNFTMADVVCFPVIAFFPRLHCPPERCPRLMEYYKMLKDRPSIKASWPPHWLEKPEGQDNLKNL
ncbi:glutathione S-transferase A-like [Sinocyclocheilus grahami]|uniref:glutathione S-transferase A-like n=1 Tax=Sinocyclocheilus grahami TaxID=75366 RepID=UPI0007ACB978|nr:PREDICTED: glutathione S-transferase A-like [Sinocyclocheilus grahami]